MASDNPAGETLGAPSVFGQIRDLVTDAIRYWEIRRLYYIAILAIIVLAHFVDALPASRAMLSVDGALGLFLLAVMANIAYSAVYVADVFIQLSGFRESRMQWRW